MVAVEDISIFIGTRNCTGVRKLPEDANDPDVVPGMMRLECTTPAGVGANLPVIISVPGAQSRANSEIKFSYAPPVITDVVLVSSLAPGSPDTAGPGDSLLSMDPTRTWRLQLGVPTAGATVALRGSGFGEPSLGGSPEFLSERLRGQVVQQTQSEVVVQLPAGDGGLDAPFQFMVGGQASATVKVR